MFNGHLSEILCQKHIENLIGRIASEFLWVPIHTHGYIHMYTHHTLIKSTLCSDMSHQHELFSSSLQCHLPLPAILHSCLKTSLSKLEVRRAPGLDHCKQLSSCTCFNKSGYQGITYTPNVLEIPSYLPKETKGSASPLTCLGFALHTQTCPLTAEEHTNRELCKCLRAKARAKVSMLAIFSPLLVLSQCHNKF